MSRGPSPRIARVAELASDEEGFTNVTLQQEFSLTASGAGALAAVAEKRLDLVVVERSRATGRTRWFGTQALADAWRADLAKKPPPPDKALLRKLDQLLSKRAEIDRAVKQLRAQIGTAPRAAAAAAPAPVAAAVAAPAVPVRPRKEGVAITVRKPPAAKPEVVAWTEKPAETTDATVYTQHQLVAEPNRINVIADPPRPIPGWGGPPPRREGSMDYLKYQAHSQHGGRP